MQIPVDPEVPNEGGDFLTCHAPGETPNSVFINCTGILRGDDWVPGDPPPPNEPVELTQINPNLYTGTLGPYDYIWTRGPLASFIEIEYPAPVNAFFQIFASCNYLWPNFFQNPIGRKYYSGFGEITWPFPTNSTTIGSLATSFGLPLGPDLLYLAYPVTTNIDVIKFQDPSKNNKISIKREFP